MCLIATFLIHLIILLSSFLILCQKVDYLHYTFFPLDTTKQDLFLYFHNFQYPLPFSGINANEDAYFHYPTTHNSFYLH